MKRFRRYSYLNVSLEQNEKDHVELKAKNKKQTKLYFIILGEVPSFLELLQLFPTFGKVIVFAGARCCRFIEQFLMKTSHLFQTIRSHRNLPFDKS